MRGCRHTTPSSWRDRSVAFFVGTHFFAISSRRSCVESAGRSPNGSGRNAELSSRRIRLGLRLYPREFNSGKLGSASQMRGTHGWAEVSAERKREIIDAIRTGTATRGPVHAELDLTDRCNVACYFCNQQSLRTRDQIPLPRLSDLIDEMAANGLRSVRLSGGGDPLFHREVLDVLDHLARRGVVVDNLTTNGLALNEEVAKRLIANKAREVIFSLNAADAADYARMMQVKPAIFDKVIENIRRLSGMRGDSIYPSIVVQFLIDRKNLHRLIDMY